MLYVWHTLDAKWWITAILMHASTDLDRIGTARQSHWNTLNCRCRHTFNKPLLRSQPIFRIAPLDDKYLPLPQPMSTRILPAAKLITNCSTWGHGEWRVSLKWLAISSYTLCTFSNSNLEGLYWASHSPFALVSVAVARSRCVSQSDLNSHSHGSCFKLQWRTKVWWNGSDDSMLSKFSPAECEWYAGASLKSG